MTGSKEPIVDMRLRILATTDLHMQMLGRTYANDRKLSHHGFAGLGQLIHDARAEADALGASCVLFDNGDSLQGNALAKHLARAEMPQGHPVAAAFNALRYDALGLGNHDFDFGLDYLNSMVSQFDMPVICSNIDLSNTPGIYKSLVLEVSPAAQEIPALRLGVLSILPQGTNIWNKDIFGGAQPVSADIQNLKDQAKTLRKAGVDLIVLLAHLGPELNEEGDSGPHCILPVIDALRPDLVIAGHTHARFPSADFQNSHQIDPVRGTLNGVACVMPGHNASDLGVVDLGLIRANGRWQIERHRTALRPNTSRSAPLDALKALFAPSDTQVRRDLDHPISWTDRPIQSYFSCLGPSTTSAWVAQAHHLIAARAMDGLDLNTRPLLASAPAITQGHTPDAPQIHEIPPGALRRRHLEGLDPYANRPCVIDVTTEMLKARIEHGCRVFSQLTPDRPTPLLNGTVPPFNFDAIFGLTYEICLSNPPGRRVQNMRFRDTPLTSGQRFHLATTRFRAAGGGGYTPAENIPLSTIDQATMEDALQKAINAPLPAHWPDAPPWRLTAQPGCKATFVTAPGALAYLDELAAFDPKVAPIADDQTIQIQITF